MFAIKKLFPGKKHFFTCLFIFIQSCNTFSEKIYMNSSSSSSKHTKSTLSKISEDERKLASLISNNRRKEKRLLKFAEYGLFDSEAVDLFKEKAREKREKEAREKKEKQYMEAIKKIERIRIKEETKRLRNLYGK